MNTKRVCCQGCGSDLDVDDAMRFVTCNYCGATLEIVHSASVTHTRQLDRIERTTTDLATNLRVIELQNEIGRLDGEWDRQREALRVRGQHGQWLEPSFFRSLLQGTAAFVAGVALVRHAPVTPGSQFFSLFGILICSLVVFTAVVGIARARRFESTRFQYASRRGRLVAELEQFRGRTTPVSAR